MSLRDSQIEHVKQALTTPVETPFDISYLLAYLLRLPFRLRHVFLATCCCVLETKTLAFKLGHLIEWWMLIGV